MKFHMIPIDYNAFWSSFTPKNRHVGDVSRTRGGTVYALDSNQVLIGDTARHLSQGKLPVSTGYVKGT